MPCQNVKKCPCVYTSCENYAKCCACVANHNHDNLPACLRKAEKDKK